MSNVMSDTCNEWVVESKVAARRLEIVLTFRCRSSIQTDVQFEEHFQTTFDLDGDDDDHLVMDGLLALFGEGLTLSCALTLAEEGWFGLWSQNVIAVHCRLDGDQLASAFNGTLFNPGSRADFVFAGGADAEHTPERVAEAARRLDKSLESHGVPLQRTLLDEIMERYTFVAYTQTSEVHAFTKFSAMAYRGALQRLATAAAKYNYVLSSQDTDLSV